MQKSELHNTTLAKKRGVVTRHLSKGVGGVELSKSQTPQNTGQLYLNLFWQRKAVNIRLKKKDCHFFSLHYKQLK